MMEDVAFAPHRYQRKVRDTVAIQFDGSEESWLRIVAFASGFARRNEFNHGWIETPTGPNRVTPGDWIGTAGPDDFYVIGAENFSRLYDLNSRQPP